MDNLAERKNNGKLRWRNFPSFLMKPLIEVAQYGEGKYAMYNFLKGGNQNQYLDSLKRHLESYEDPNQPDNDPESGIVHLAHIAWNALVAAYMLENYPELDDRWKGLQPKFMVDVADIPEGENMIEYVNKHPELKKEIDNKSRCCNRPYENYFDKDGNLKEEK